MICWSRAGSKISHFGHAASTPTNSIHGCGLQTAGRWPLAPQDGWHEVVGTLGEVRGDYSGESRHHLHGGLDIRGDVGATVLAIADGKVSSPSAAWNFDGLSEGLGLGALDYIHMRVGRTPRGDLLDPVRFQLLHDLSGDPSRIRVRRGTRFAAGDALGTVNRMAHVHLSIGPSGYERNAIALGFAGFTDAYPPRIDEVALFDTLDQPIDQRHPQTGGDQGGGGDRGGDLQGDIAGQPGLAEGIVQRGADGGVAAHAPCRHLGVRVDRHRRPASAT